jgi:transposase
MTRRSQAKKTVRKRYSKEFKDEALALTEKLGVPAAAKELGLHESQLYGWRVKSRAERDRSETERNQATEIARLKRKVAEQAEELAIVKKAAAYFAKGLK